MFAKLKGIIDTKLSESLVLDVQGVGYLVNCAGETISKLPSVGDYVELFIESIFREDGFFLYGFIHYQEQVWFRNLRDVKGIGPKLAANLIGSLGLDNLIKAISTKDIALVSSVSGVGKKIAERLMIEMKNKVEEVDISNLNSIQDRNSDNSNEKFEDLISALINLGYNKHLIFPTIKRIFIDNPKSSISELIKLSLKELSK